MELDEWGWMEGNLSTRQGLEHSLWGDILSR